MANIKKKTLMPPDKIGIIGGGQLGRMLSYEAKRMGYYVSVLDPTPSCPAGQVSDNQITASFSDYGSIKELADSTDVLTYEFEHIDADILCKLESEGYKIYPSGDTLKKIQNKLSQKQLLKKAGLPVPSFSKVENTEDIFSIINEYGLPVLLKTCYGGYDGKGNIVIRNINDVEKAYEAFKGKEIMVEQFIDFKCELSIIVGRGFDGSTSTFPVVENIHKDSILNLTKAPAQIDDSIKNKVESVARQVLDVFDDYGIFCIEMFLDKKEDVYINEIAPRPHNSGHYTIEACYTSQYEQLLRIITGLPQGLTKLISPCAMVNILGNNEVNGEYTFNGFQNVLLEERVYIHVYGKRLTKNLKKIGHITVLNELRDTAVIKAQEALDKIKIKPLI
ncbi:5-(carboxyamino)imidazole ribonucleotide synthase [Herbivorax sp. ANBcel31]|uniref:5-(carboxyamino)imidazole ribonucleotide synthase n=1 Tax=Herbivorax sp. ANBcel31 TaxID=3069754 RepID=UPI0027B81143|nr:5-(carboxyamino)imidazole ribonucleotide synthase [Herbivorax sp. ANBcel31]MDQ2085815.1 5-(carboxyamino)imidazole ribonucleotide synthase [Herbivorax sp. ANBcel31]